VYKQQQLIFFLFEKEQRTVRDNRKKIYKYIFNMTNISQKISLSSIKHKRVEKEI